MQAPRSSESPGPSSGTKEPEPKKTLLWFALVAVAVVVVVLVLFLRPSKQDELEVNVVVPPVENRPVAQPSEPPVAPSKPDDPLEFADRAKVTKMSGSEAEAKSKAIRGLGNLASPDDDKPKEPEAPTRASNAGKKVSMLSEEPGSNKPITIPSRSVLNATMMRLSRCPTMKGCVDQARSALELFGATDPVGETGDASIEKFKEVQSAYRRSHADVLRAARGLRSAPGGAAAEDSLRAIFEAVPQADTWELSEDETKAIRAGLEPSLIAFMREQRIEARDTISVVIQALTAAAQVPIQAHVRVESGLKTVADRRAVEAHIEKKLASLGTIERTGRQRFANFKLVVNPAGSIAIQ